MWQIIISLKQDRTQEGVLTVWTYSASLNKFIQQYSCPCLGHGDGGDWTHINGDTPTGGWNGTIIGPGGTSPNDSLGVQNRIDLSSSYGNAYTAEHTYERSGFQIHGGRRNLEPPLYLTHGCIRVYEEDMPIIQQYLDDISGTVRVDES